MTFKNVYNFLKDYAKGIYTINERSEQLYKTIEKRAKKM
jgi:hypothetical protein